MKQENNVIINEIELSNKQNIECLESKNYLYYKAVKVMKSEGKIEDFAIDKYNRFYNKIWDFNYKNKMNRSPFIYKIKFDNNNYEVFLRLMSLKEITIINNSINTVKSKVSNLKTFINYLIKNNINDFRLINCRVLKEYIEDKEKKCKASNISHIICSIKEFFEVITEVSIYKFEDVFNLLNEKGKKYSFRKYSISANNYIPDYFFNQIISIAVKDMNNEKLRYNRRIVAALIIILAYTGMREEEIIMLETSKLKSIEVLGKSEFYLEFYVFKNCHIKGEPKLTRMYMHPLAADAYLKCEKFVDSVITDLAPHTKERLFYYLYSGEKISWKDKVQIFDKLSNEELERLDEGARKYIYISDTRGSKKTHSTNFRWDLQNFFIYHYKDFDISKLSQLEYEQIRFTAIRHLSEYKRAFSKKDIVRIPYVELKNVNIPYVGAHQFRVTVCTKLFKQKVPLDYIRRHMNHLDNEITAYYNKSYTLKSSLNEGLKILSDLSTSNGLLSEDIDENYMENKELNVYIKNVNNFLRRNKLNIRKNLDEITNILIKTNTTILENEFGICIKNIITGICSNRKNFYETNQYFLEYKIKSLNFLSEHYKRFLEKEKVVNYNKLLYEKDNSYYQEYQREKNLLINYIKSILIPEMDMLIKEIEDYGNDYTIKKYESIDYIIRNFEGIKRDIGKWIIK